MTEKLKIHVGVCALIAAALMLVNTPMAVIIGVCMVAGGGIEVAREQAEHDAEAAYRRGCEHTARVWETYLGGGHD